MHVPILSKGLNVHIRNNAVAFETSCVYSVNIFLRRWKKSCYLRVMSYKLFQRQEISWYREIHVSPIQPSNALLPVSGMYRTSEFSCGLCVRHLRSLLVT